MSYFHHPYFVCVHFVWSRTFMFIWTIGRSLRKSLQKACKWYEEVHLHLTVWESVSVEIVTRPEYSTSSYRGCRFNTPGSFHPIRNLPKQNLLFSSNPALCMLNHWHDSGAPLWNRALIAALSHTCASPDMTSQTVGCEHSQHSQLWSVLGGSSTFSF